MRTRIKGLAERWAREGHDLGLGIGIAQGYATLGTIGFEGRHDYAAIGSVTNLAARLCADAAAWEILVTERVFASAGSLVIGEDAGQRDLKGFSRSVHTIAVKGTDTSQDDVVTGDLWTAPARTDETLSSLTEAERYRRFDALQARLPHVWDAHAPQPRGRVGGRGPLHHPRQGRRGQREPHPGLRGAVPVPAHAAAAAAAPDGLRDLAARGPGDHRVLPVAAPGRDPQPRAGAALAGRRARLHPALAQREAPRAAPAAVPDRGDDPQPGPLPPGALQHDRAGARPRGLARHPDVRRRPPPRRPRVQDRLPAALRGAGRAAPAGPGEPPQHGRGRGGRAWRCGRSGPP